MKRQHAWKMILLLALFALVLGACSQAAPTAAPAKLKQKPKLKRPQRQRRLNQVEVIKSPPPRKENTMSVSSMSAPTMMVAGRQRTIKLVCLLKKMSTMCTPLMSKTWPKVLMPSR